MSETPTPAIPKVALTVPEAAEALGISERAVWTLIRTEGLPVVRLGRRTVIYVESLHEWLRERSRPRSPATTDQAEGVSP